MKHIARGTANFLLVALGILSAAFGLKGFLLSSRFIDGGVTVYKGRRGLTDADQDILFFVVTRLEIGRLRSLVADYDPSAFVVIPPLSDVHGGVEKPVLH